MNNSYTERQERGSWEPVGNGSHGEGFGLNSKGNKEPLEGLGFDRERSFIILEANVRCEGQEKQLLNLGISLFNKIEGGLYWAASARIRSLKGVDLLGDIYYYSSCICVSQKTTSHRQAKVKHIIKSSVHHPEVTPNLSDLLPYRALYTGAHTPMPTHTHIGI